MHNNKTAAIFMDKKYVSYGLKHIKENHYKFFNSYDSKSVMNTIEVLEINNFNIEIITWDDYLTRNSMKFNVFVVTQYAINKIYKANAEEKEIALKIRKDIQNGSNFILLHHTPIWLFSDCLDILHYGGNQRGYFQNNVSLKITKQHKGLLTGVNEYAKKHNSEMGQDEFTYVFKSNGKFEMLIEKVPQKKQIDQKFIMFGYQKQKQGNYIFIIDIHNIGVLREHSSLFNILFANTLQFITSEETIEKTIEKDIEAYELENEGQVSKEGALIKSLVNKYERNPKLRAEAIRIHGFNCMACGFNFNNFYGDRGYNFIEVHHIKPLFKVKNEHKVNPNKDMIVLCANCHRMIHRRTDKLLSLSGLKKRIRNGKAKLS